VLPPELKDEVAEIMKFGFIAEKHKWGLELTKVDEDTVQIITTVERTFVNKTSFKQNTHGLYTVEDLNFPNGPSEILECEIQDESGNVKRSEAIKNAHGLEATTDEITVEPGHKVTVRGKAKQYGRTNGFLFETFLAPTVNPQIDVTIPDDFAHHVEFGATGDKEKEKYRNLYTLSGVYFPRQIMSVRWWPKHSTATT
jgi:hypothetical protein